MGKIQDDPYRYCPDWTAPNKSGRPKKAERHKSGLEEAMAKAKGEKKPPKMKRRRLQFVESGITKRRVVLF